jgi:ribose transport system permease protein
VRLRVREAGTPGLASATGPASGAGAVRASFIVRHPGMVLGGVATILLVIAALTTPAFASYANALAILRAGALTGIVAVGMTFVTISGNYFSLSVLQTAVMASMLYAHFARSGGAMLLAILLVVAAAAAIGGVQGAAVSAGGNPVIVTLAAGALILALILAISNDHQVILHAGQSSLAVRLGTGRPLGIPTETWCFVIISVIGAVLLKWTAWGRRLTLCGANRKAAVAAGLRVPALITLAFVASAVAAALAGVLNAAQFGIANAEQLTGLDIGAIAAVLVGGTAIQGGEGSIGRTVVGTLFVALLQNILQIRGYAYGVQLACEGAAVVLTVCAYTYMRRRTR